MIHPTVTADSSSLTQTVRLLSEITLRMPALIVHFKSLDRLLELDNYLIRLNLIKTNHNTNLIMRSYNMAIYGLIPCISICKIKESFLICFNWSECHTLVKGYVFYTNLSPINVINIQMFVQALAHIFNEFVKYYTSLNE